MPPKTGTPGQSTETEDQETTETESTSTADSTENEETETTEESTESQTSEDGQPSKKDTSKELLFVDPKNLPAELKPHFARMQASFTRKMQALSGVAKKAEAFDNLVKMPKFHRFMDELEGRTTSAPGNRLRPKEGKEEAEGGDAVEALVDERVKPLEARLNQADLKEEYADFAEKYPFHSNYTSQLREHLDKNPQHTFEQALAIVSFPDLLELMGDQLSKNIEGKKKASVNRPDRTTASPSKVTGGIKTVQEAWNLAKKQLAGRG